MNAAPIYLTEREVISALRVCRRTLFNLRNTQGIAFERFGRSVRYPLSGLPKGLQDDYLRARAANS